MWFSFWRPQQKSGISNGSEAIDQYLQIKTIRVQTKNTSKTSQA